LQWIDDEEFTIDGVHFLCRGIKVGLKSVPDRFCIIKPRWQVERYARVLEALAPKKIVEIGIFDGGSTAFLAQYVRPQKLVALELAEQPCAALEQFIESRGLRDVVSTHYGVDQSSTQRLTEIIDEEFGDEQLDLVIDDASHLFEPTRRSFRCLFPRVAPGGAYVIEDWSADLNVLAAAHPTTTPLPALVLELVLMCGQAGVIDEIVVAKGFALIRRGHVPIDRDAFDPSAYLGKVARGLMRDIGGASEPVAGEAVPSA
jgi:hypothetical protein